MFERSMCDSEAFQAPSSIDESDLTGSNPSEEEGKGPLVFMPQPFVTLKVRKANQITNRLSMTGENTSRISGTHGRCARSLVVEEQLCALLGNGSNSQIVAYHEN